MNGAQRRARLKDARLYLCTPIRDDLAAFLNDVLDAGVDVVQLRDKHADAHTLLRAAEVFRETADRHAALFVMNDRADLALACGADGVHVGQDDLPPDIVRDLVGEDLLVGFSTHSEEQLERANEQPADYFGVGPVHATPTKPGREGTGLELVRVAARIAKVPWFVTGGMDAMTLPAAMDAGCTRAVVVRAITEAGDPATAAAKIAQILNG